MEAGVEVEVNTERPVTFYLCPRCLTADERPGLCPRCKVERLGCDAGIPEDVCRRPLMDDAGRIRTRAPLWWLRKTVAALAERWANE